MNIIERQRNIRGAGPALARSRCVGPAQKPPQVWAPARAGADPSGCCVDGKP